MASRYSSGSIMQRNAKWISLVIGYHIPNFQVILLAILHFPYEIPILCDNSFSFWGMVCLTFTQPTDSMKPDCSFMSGNSFSSSILLFSHIISSGCDSGKDFKIQQCTFVVVLGQNQVGLHSKAILGALAQHRETLSVVAGTDSTFELLDCFCIFLFLK